jgi:hypothetical protein
MAEKSQRRFHTKYKQKCIKKRGCGCQLTVRQKTHIFPNNSTSKFAVVISPDMLRGMKNSSALNRLALNISF